MNEQTAPQQQAPTRISTMRLSDAKTIGDALQTTQFQRAVADAAPAHMTSQRLMATFRQAARNNPAFAQCNLMSVLGVFMTCTFLGLEPNTPLGHAYMIPFAKKRFDKSTRTLVDDGYDLQLIIGYQGYLDLAYRNSRVSSIAAHAVFDGDVFSFEYGSNEHLQHRPKGLSAEGDLPQYFYMFAKLQGGQAFEVLPTSRVMQIRNGSQGYRAALASKDKAVEKGWKIPASFTEAPWVKHFIAMGQKTALRHGYKWLPKTVEMAAVTRLEDAQDKALLDFGPVLEGSVNPLEEDLPPLYESHADPGAAFGERSQGDDGSGAGDLPPMQGEWTPPLAAAQRPAQRETAPPAATAPASRKTPPSAPPSAPPLPAAPATPQGFAGFLSDAAGDLIATVGDGGYVVDPVVYARGYAAVWATTPADQRLALSEHNADPLIDATAADPDAARIIDEIMNPPPAAADPAAMASIVVAAHNGKPDLKGYLDALRTAAAAQTFESYPKWEGLQRPVITAISTVTRRAAEKICADRATALGTDKPAPAASSAAQPPPSAAMEPPPNTGDDAPAGESHDELLGEPIPHQPWSRKAQNIFDQLRQCTKLSELDDMARNAATQVMFRQIGEADAGEGERLKVVAAERRAALKSPQH